MKTLLSLFDYSGRWCKPYVEAKWNVIQIDIKLGTDIMDVDLAWLDKNIFSKSLRVHGILAAPPCTDFAVSGAQYWKAKDKDGRTENSLRLVKQTLKIIDICNPDFWALENPVGRLPKLLPEIGKPWYF